MRMLSWLLLLNLATWCGAAEFDLYYLGGQSNMDGYRRNEDLPEDLQSPMDGVWIYHSPAAADNTPATGEGIWAPLKPGHGVGFAFADGENRYSDRFGVELAFARTLRRANPDRPIAIIKYSRGGTSIAAEAARQFGSWDPDFRGGEGEGAGINQYDHFLATVREATRFADLDGDGEPDRLIPRGIVWMQGESDAALDIATAQEYGDNLKQLIDLIRAALRMDDLPVAVGRISDSKKNEPEKTWPFGDIVRARQAKFCKQDPAATLVTSTDDYGYSDPWHYDSAGYVDLGREFAEALLPGPPQPN